MTEEYKKNLIDYVTNLINQGQPQQQDFNITNINGIEYTSSDWQNIIESFRLQNAAINGILEDEKYDNFIMYGGWQEQAGENSKGFLIYLDKNGKPTKLLKLNTRGFQFLKFDEETNRVYGTVGNRATNLLAENNDTYFVYYNNLFIVETPIQTYAYKIWNKVGNDGASNFMTRDIVKDSDGTNYLIFGSMYLGTFSPKVLELKINVGQSNELKTWLFSDMYQYYASYGWYSNGTPHFKAICLNITSSPYPFALAQDNGDNVTYTNLQCDTEIKSRLTFYIRPNFMNINENLIYFVYNARWSQDSDTINNECTLYKFNGTKIETIYKTPITQSVRNDEGIPMSNLPMLNIIKDKDNTIYVLRYMSDENNNYTKVSLLNLTRNSVIEDNNWVDIGTYNYVYRANILSQESFSRRNFNIINIFSYSSFFRTSFGSPVGRINGFQVNIQNLTPINGYNGQPYYSVNSLVPKYVNLYSNNSLIFSRNLYNITKQNNQSMSSVEIPNTYLNDTSITKNNLISETNLLMNQNNQQWNKNIYEVVDINFLNTIRVIDEDTGEEYLESAIKLNEATTDGGISNYQNTPCNKFRINYNDDSTSIHNLVWTSIDDTHKETLITFYVDKAINSIDLISNDETTIYLKIPVEVEVGKYYSISQKIRIGE